MTLPILIALLIAAKIILITAIYRRRHVKRMAMADRRPTFEEAFAAAAMFDFDHINARFKDEHDLTRQQVSSVELEFKRFFALAATTDHLGMPGCIVDDYWHAVICDTKLYRKFCSDVAGRFIEHDPRDGKPGGAAGLVSLYECHLGERPPVEFSDRRNYKRFAAALVDRRPIDRRPADSRIDTHHAGSTISESTPTAPATGNDMTGFMAAAIILGQPGPTSHPQTPSGDSGAARDHDIAPTTTHHHIDHAPSSFDHGSTPSSCSSGSSSCASSSGGSSSCSSSSCGSSSCGGGS